MTEAEINRAVAEHLGQPLEPPCERYHSTDESEHSEDGWSGFCYTCGLPISEVAPEPRRYCSDPAAWGGLFEHLCREKRNPMLWWERQDRIGASVNTEPRYDCAAQVEAFDALPGRALALAALRAHGVEVPQ